jgi:hypothetical protein
VSDSQPVQTPPPSAGGSPFDHLPLWLRDWRIFAVLLLVMVLGGQGVGDAVRGLLGLQAAPSAATEQHTCCQAIEARLSTIEASLGRVLAYCRSRGVLPPSTTGAATPSSAARESGTMTAVGSVP